MSFKSSLKQLVSNINFNVKIQLNNKDFTIPVIKNMGLLNRALDKDDWFLRLLQSLNLQADEDFIDIGVNVGQTLLKFRSVYENTYWGFEPNPSCVYYLDQLIKANHFKNINLIPVGLSTESSIAKFYLKNEVDSAGTMINELRPGYYSADDITYIPLFSLDQLQLDIKGRITLIKIDVEGAEPEVLSGMPETLKKHQPLIVCEVLDSHTNENITKMQHRADQLVKLMQSLNYSIYSVNHSGNVIGLQPLSEIRIKKWSPESWNENDYLFMPAGNKYADLLKISRK